MYARLVPGDEERARRAGHPGTFPRRRGTGPSSAPCAARPRPPRRRRRRRERAGRRRRRARSPTRTLTPSPNRRASPPPRPAMGLVEVAVQRRLAPTSGRAVHDVVVEEGEAVQQLDAGGDVQPRAVVRITAGGQEAVAAEERTEPLPPASVDLRQELDRFGEPWVDGGPAVTLAPRGRRGGGPRPRRRRSRRWERRARRRRPACIRLI